LLLERLGVIPNYVSEDSNNRLTLNKEYIKTGSAELDSLFDGKGIESGAVTEFYGQSGSGKTQICHTLCVAIQQLHSENKAIYIDTEGKFRPERIAQIANEKGLDCTKVLSNIKSARTLNSSRLETILRQECSSHIAKESNMKLLVVDSIASHYRAEYAGYSMLSQRQHQLNKIMNLLQNMAQVYNIAVVITNQVLNSTHGNWGNSDKPIGGNIMAHTSTFRIQLHGSNPDCLNSKLISSSCYPQSEKPFAINKGGIANVEKY
jgi:DNA repair protein RadA